MLNSSKVVSLETNILKIDILPDLGGKMISLFYKPKNKELLWKTPDRKYRKPKYGDIFEDYGMSGFDECFPAVAEGHYPSRPWKDIVIPDHGELWTLPWKHRISENSIYLWVYGVRFAYRLDKWVTLDDNRLKLEYKVTNLSPFKFKYIWSSHPLFRITSRTKIDFPLASKIKIYWSHNGRFDTGSREYSWPLVKDKQGNEVNLSSVGYSDSGFADKFFVTNLTEGWCKLTDTKDNWSIKFSFSLDEIPCVGLWINQGGWPQQNVGTKNHFNMGLEPCSSPYEDLFAADKGNKCSTIPPEGTVEWNLTLELSEN